MYKTIIIFAIVGSMFLVVGNVYAQGPSIPALILGNVTSNGALVEKGKVLYVLSDDVVLTNVIIEENGRFGPVEIPEPSNKTITFKLDNDNINETYVWREGIIPLALTVSIAIIKDSSETPVFINNVSTPTPAPTSIIDLTGIQGSIGDQGALGDSGILGNPGPPGSAGIIGAPGPQGPVGTQGLLGEVGPVGEPGIQGESGVPGIDGESNQMLTYAGILFVALGIVSAGFVYREYRNIA